MLQMDTLNTTFCPQFPAESEISLSLKYPQTTKNEKNNNGAGGLGCSEMLAA
jgi:hypothetical protein